MAKATARKTATRRRRERKNIERGAAHIQSTFNNTIVTITDTQGNPVCRADRCGDRCKGCHGTWAQDGRSVRKRTWLGP